MMGTRSLWFVCLFSILVLSGQMSWAEKYPGEYYLHARVVPCNDELTPERYVQPWFRAGNPSAPMPTSILGQPMNHKFTAAFTFSKDGKFIAIHHEMYPDAEQINVWSLETYHKIVSLVWRGKDRTLFSLRSAAVDGQNGTFIGLTDNFFSNRSDGVARWDGRDSGSFQTAEIPPPRDEDFEKTPVYRTNSEIARSPILPELESSYYVRTYYRSASIKYGTEGHEFSAQVVDWKSKSVLNIPQLSVDYLRIIPEPINSRFGYAAFLNEDERTVQIEPLSEIAGRMRGQRSAAIRFASWIQRRISKAPVPFQVKLDHDQKIKQVYLSPTSPKAVVLTGDGLHIWNVDTGKKIKSLSGHFRNFQLLEPMGLVAYQDSFGHLNFYSMSQDEVIAVLPNLSRYKLNWEKDEYGQIFVAAEQGSTGKWLVTRIDLRINRIENTGLQLEIPLNLSLHTTVATTQAKYFVQIYEEHSLDSVQLKIRAYSLDGSGKLMAEMSFPVQTPHSQFTLDPSGQRVIFTRDEQTTGLLDIKGLLEKREL